MCEKCRLIELFDEELARFESYDNGEAFSIARHRYALERHGISEGRAMVIAHSEPFQGPTPPSREERIERAAKKILGLRKDCLYCEDHGLCEAEISIVLTELMEGNYD